LFSFFTPEKATISEELTAWIKEFPSITPSEAYKIVSQEVVNILLQNNEFLFENQRLLFIGSGSYGNVYLNLQSGRIIKMSTDSILENTGSLSSEALVLKNILGEDAVTYEPRFPKNRRPSIIQMPYEGIDSYLFFLIMANIDNDQLSIASKQQLFYTFMLSAAEALSSFHEKYGSHGDVKDVNFTFKTLDNETLSAGLIDFGNSMDLQNSKYSQNTQSYIKRIDTLLLLRTFCLLRELADYPLSKDLENALCEVKTFITELDNKAPKRKSRQEKDYETCFGLKYYDAAYLAIKDLRESKCSMSSAERIFAIKAKNLGVTDDQGDRILKKVVSACQTELEKMQPSAKKVSQATLAMKR
jgi:serine/threonine protein kinase